MLFHCAAGAEVTLVAVGDLRPPARGSASPFAALEPWLARADLAFANLESPLLEGGLPTPGKVPAHRAAPEFAGQLEAFNVISLANNHMLDYGPAGAQSTAVALEQQGIRAVGPAEVTLLRQGLEISFLAFTDPGLDSEQIARRVQHHASRGRLVVVSLHWGQEGSDRPGNDQRNLAYRLVDAGATLILGHHPHVMQGVERRGRALIAYSLGNCVWPGPRGEGLLLEVQLDASGVESYELQPLELVQGRPRPAPNLQRRLHLLCAELGVLEPREFSAGDGFRLGGGVLTAGRWRSPAGWWVQAAERANLFGSREQLLVLLEKLTLPREWAGSWKTTNRYRTLTQHLAVVEDGRIRWLSSPLPQRLSALELRREGKELYLVGPGTLYRWTGWAFVEP